MNSILKTGKAYKTIGEVAKELGLVDGETGALQTHTLRYWETQFKQIKPQIGIGKRRYYSKKNFQVIKFIKFLLREKGLTINGVKRILNKHNLQALDENIDLSIYKTNLKIGRNVKDRIKRISKIVKELKDYK